MFKTIEDALVIAKACLAYRLKRHWKVEYRKATERSTEDDMSTGLQKSCAAVYAPFSFGRKLSRCEGAANPRTGHGAQGAVRHRVLCGTGCCAAQETR
ncbi:hypothetical protein N7457_004143 [Penicillium paradoxum]|uniref:uncharacterized protein n=1 Tax=Penicillium paradoxum TaxID=176176 RepID=UPI002549431D|nr:uncharacterized protein N7457_004143 [Penicillium paradoxum]KAJ5782369.1 hypothetical protein N7457_004143 [Penicillium paradoxum]